MDSSKRKGFQGTNWTVKVKGWVNADHSTAVMLYEQLNRDLGQKDASLPAVAPVL